MTDFEADAEIASGSEGDVSVQDDIFADGRVQAKWGVQSNAVPVTATADGLTTGLITEGVSFVQITSANADHIITLPSLTDDVVGHVIFGWVGANGCEIRTPAASGTKINGVDSDGTNEAAIPATTLIMLVAVSETDGWILYAWTELGAAVAAIVPDAA